MTPPLPTHPKKVCVCVCVCVRSLLAQGDPRPGSAAMPHARRLRLEEARRRLDEERQELAERQRQLDWERRKFEEEKQAWATRNWDAGFRAGREAERAASRGEFPFGGGGGGEGGGGRSPPNVPVDTPGRASIQV